MIIALTAIRRIGRLQNAALVASSVVVALAVLETVATTIVELQLRRNPDLPKYDGGASFAHEHPDLGFAPAEASVQILARKRVNGRSVYDVTYSIDENRHRLTRGKPDAPCTILFFGDSFHFGEGLNDDDTLPERFSAELGHRLNVVNLAFQGYGPHQMLRALELGLPNRLVRGRVGAAYTVLLPSHIWRVRGLYRLMRLGPRYRLDDVGRPVYAGRLDRPSGTFTSWAAFRREWQSILRGSALYDHLHGSPEFDDPAEVEFSVRLTVAILTRSAEIIRDRYQVALRVIGWEDDAGRMKPILERLRTAGVDAVEKDALLVEPWSTDDLIVGDGHPSAKANREIAHSLAGGFHECL